MEKFIFITTFQTWRDRSMWSTLDFYSHSTVIYLNSRGESSIPEIPGFAFPSLPWTCIPWELGMATGPWCLWDIFLHTAEITEQIHVTGVPWIPHSKTGTMECRIHQYCAKPFCLTVLQVNSSTRSLALDGGFDKTNYPAPDPIWLNCTAFVAAPQYSAGQRFVLSLNKTRWGFVGPRTRCWFCQHKACYDNPSLVQQLICFCSNPQLLSWPLPPLQVAVPSSPRVTQSWGVLPSQFINTSLPDHDNADTFALFFSPNKNHFNLCPEYKKCWKCFTSITCNTF